MKLLPSFMMLFTACVMASCNSGASVQSHIGGNAGPTNNPSNNKTKQPVQPAAPGATTNTDSESGTEITDTPVYAVWVATQDNNKMYDGMYDSASGYLRLCDSKQLIHVDDPGEILVNANKSCYSQGNTLKMITIKKGVSGKPLFLTVLHVDPVGRHLVALTDNHDTIVTSAKTMDPAAFEKLKTQYEVTPFSPGELDKIKHYYAPEMEVQNAQKKAQVIKMNALMLKK